MQNQHHGKRAVSLLAASLLAAGLMHGTAAFAQADSALPAVKTSGNIEYLSGGIGIDESTAIKNVAGQWPLSLVFSVKSGAGAEYASNVTLVVRDAKGAVVLETAGSGPYLLVKLEPGTYELHATLAGKVLEQQVQVKARTSTRLELVWPAGTNKN